MNTQVTWAYIVLLPPLRFENFHVNIPVQKMISPAYWTTEMWLIAYGLGLHIGRQIYQMAGYDWNKRHLNPRSNGEVSDNGRT